MQEIFDENARCIKVYLGVETQVDPYEKNIEVTFLDPVNIRAIVSDLNFSQIQWKMPGIVTDKAKEIMIEKVNKNMLLLSQKIKIDTEFYEGWRVNGQMQYKEEGDFIRAYIYLKQV